MIKEYREIILKKMIQQSGMCAVCNKALSLNQPQLAHILPKTKSNVKKYGLEIIDHERNLALVCSLKCNSAVLIGSAFYEREKMHVEKIRKEIEKQDGK